MLALYQELRIKDLCLQEADKHTQLAIAYLDKINANPKKKKELKNFALGLLKRQV